jgi:hypothetical protein
MNQEAKKKRKEKEEPKQKYEGQENSPLHP